MEWLIVNGYFEKVLLSRILKVSLDISKWGWRNRFSRLRIKDE